MANRDVIVKLRLAGEEFDRDFKIKFQDLTDAAEKASADAGTKAGSKFGAGFAAAAGAAGAAMGLAINSAANLGQEIANTSRQFNVGVENLQIWRQAAATAGVSANDLSEGLGSLTEKIGEANAGNRQAQQGFADLGVSFKTASGQARATDAVMLDLAKRIADVEDPSERVRLGMQLLGDDFKNLYPLLLQGADGFNAARIELGEFGAMLSHEEIRNLEKTNAKIEQMKTVLSIRVAGVVAENANAILGLADAIATTTGAMIKFATEYPRFSGMLAGAAVGSRAGPFGALAGGLAGITAGDRNARALEDANMDVQFRQRKLAEARRERERASFGSDEPASVQAERRRNAERELKRQTALMLEATRAAISQAMPAAAAQASGAPPRVDALRATAPRAGGARNPTQPAAEREAERAAKKALDEERKLTDQINRTLRAQEDSARIAQTRADQGEVAAAMLEAELNLMRQIPELQARTVEELAKALGYTEKLTEEDRQRLAVQLEKNKLAVANATSEAGARAQGELDREAAREQERNDDLARRAADRWAAEHERAVLDVANIYETAFRGGTDELWSNFKDEGTRIIAEIAAEWTLAMISGQPFNFGGAAEMALGRSPLASLFGGAGRGRFDATLFGGAANDNGPTMTGFGGGIFGMGGGFMRGNGRGGTLLPSGAEPGLIPNGMAGAGFLQSPTFALGIGTLASSIFGNGSTGSQLGGMVGSIGGQALGSSLGFLGAAGGPVGAIAGAILGSILPSLLSGTKRGSATVGSVGGTLGITGTRGNSRSRRETASASAGSLIDAIFQIAEELGGSVDASRGSVSIGVRNDNFRVDPTGQGRTRTRRGAVDFGSDQEAAIRFAVQDLIADGVITGISQASQNLLQRGGDLEAQIEKALLIEQIPKLLRQRMDPLGAALDEIYEKFKQVNDALVEGSASAEQFAQARQLWELEKADAIASIGAASQTLADFLASLNAGSNSPLSLREQRAEAERQLEPFLAQISAAESARAEVDRLRASGASAADIERAEAAARTAAAAINQDGFTQASQLLLSISRQSNASTGAFFSDFDRIRALTGQAIGFVDQASARPGDARDPFSQAIAQNTQDAAIILSEQTAILNQILAAVNDNGGALSVGNGNFIGQARLFAN
jgi:hypothetical protein